MKFNKKTIFQNIIACVAFLAIPIFLFPHPPEEKDFIFSRPTQRDFIGNLMMLIFFYLNYYFLIPQFYFKKKYLFYFSFIAVSFLIITTVPSIVTNHDLFSKEVSFETPVLKPVEALPKPKGFTFIEEIRHHIFLYTAMILFSILLRTRNRLLESEQAKHVAEINSLKEQINPHFLFNTLNSIYALAIRDQSSTTANAILKLSGMMRYIVTETSSTFVALQKELSYVKDYIDLQRLRLDKRIELSFEIIGSVGDQVIAPLTLIPFIENAFKHGVNPDEYSRINILVEVQETELKLTVENNKVTTTLSSHEHSGKGIANTRSRLQLLYPSRHLLILKEGENHFHVQLTIQLQ